MKRKIIISLVIIALIIFSLYKFLYKSHRNISSEDASFTLSAKSILNDYKVNEEKANKKYLDKTIIINGTISSIDQSSKTLVIDEKMFCIIDSIQSNLELNKPISIKGRFLGYDDLLEEMKMDQITILK